MYFGMFTIAPIMSVNFPLLSGLAVTPTIVACYCMVATLLRSRRRGSSRSQLIVWGIAIGMLVGIAGVGVDNYVNAATSPVTARQAAKLTEFGFTNVQIDPVGHTFTGTYDGTKFYGHLEGTGDVYAVYTDKVIEPLSS